TDLLDCQKLWLEDVYERLAGPKRGVTIDSLLIAGRKSSTMKATKKAATKVVKKVVRRKAKG
ncbi:hypothetical protein, partial [Dyella sp. RRB7]|uniref:hypothetical protein n=1 Tax=Dyella sp. RRB7 TaxID=2919502 RepID=UPI001FAB3115